MVVVLAAGCAGQAASSTVPVSSRAPITSRVPRQLWPQGVAFWSSRDGVVVGDLSAQSCGAGRCGGVIETTTDGGRDWTMRTRVKGQLTAVTSVPGGGLVATVSGRGLLVSGDGGDAWDWLTHHRVGNPSFATATQGWALTGSAGLDHGSVATTADGGRTWRMLSDPCRRWAVAQSVSAVSPAGAYIACGGQPGVGNQAKMIVRTSDGGATWTAVDAVPLPGGPGPQPAPPHGLPSGGYVSGIAMLPDRRGWLWSDRGWLLRTDDGEHWRTVARNTVQPDVVTVVSADLVSRSSGYMLLWGNSATHLLRTTDGGQRWTQVHAWPG
jgi:photosystem II stability/assembly factor-like uncharacterized protein